MINTLKISFIGGGNMTRSLICGLIADGFEAQNIIVSDNNADQLATLKQQLAINTTASNIDAAKSADIVVLAVKPQTLQTVCNEISTAVQARQPLLISIAAGIREADLQRWLGAGSAIVRTMPNTPALVQTGATALYANTHVSDEQRDAAETIMRAVGLTLWLEDEQLMDAVTAVSGSGPAYFFLFMEAIEQAGEKLGLPKATAHLLTLQTALGAAKMALESSEDCATLRTRVTSPGGTTEQAINALEEGQLRELVTTALNAATNRSKELAQQLGKDD